VTQEGSRPKEGVLERGKGTFHLLLITSCLVLLALPFITTLNGFLAVLATKSHLDALLESWVVPVEVGLIAVFLNAFGIEPSVSPVALNINGSRLWGGICINWNCVGWQSFLLLVITLITGLRGGFTFISKLECVLIGFLGTFMVNILRMSAVGIIAFHFGQTPALAFHDYVGPIIVLIWLAIFWLFCYRYVLEAPGEGEYGVT
jgi:exosortase/archaeosortase family protein